MTQARQKHIWQAFAALDSCHSLDIIIAQRFRAVRRYQFYMLPIPTQCNRLVLGAGGQDVGVT
jgi:hypothetical protein